MGPRVKGLPVVREERYEHRDVGSVYPPLSILQGAASLREAGFEAKRSLDEGILELMKGYRMLGRLPFKNA